MYLKSLEVCGFKSFAGKMLFEFHDGITAIVGPNGSGKSNVADAVRWVLGEQSARQLRGAKMEDVIFAGTQLRKPMGSAYVAITISNEDHRLDVPYEEVKIARRVYRSGESEYLLNGAACRLKDVQELLFDTGIGKEGYSIIGQGQIDRILSGKPEDRRELFDEAAGIVKYKKRKSAAQKNLEEEQQNLTRVEDILSELEHQVGPLKEQSDKAKEYLSLRDELQNLDINLFLEEYDAVGQQKGELEEKRQIAAHDLAMSVQELEQTKEEYETLEERLASLNQSLEQRKETLTADRVSLNQSEGEIKLLEEQINTVHQNKAHRTERIDALKEKKNAVMQEQASYDAKAKEASAELQKLSFEQEALEKTLSALDEKIKAYEDELKSCDQDMLSYLNENTDVMTDRERLQTLLEQTSIKKAEMTKRVLENKTEASKLQEALEQEKAALSDFSGKKKAMDDAILELNRAKEASDRETQRLEQEHRQTQQQYHMKYSRLKSLKSLTERYEGYGQSIKRVMEKKAEVPGIIGVVADIIRVQKKYELAVETALGGSIQNIVTDNEQTAKAMIQFLKKNRFGRATFLPLTNMRAKPVNLSGSLLAEEGVIGIASTLVDADPQFSNLVEYLLGRFVVVDQIDHAIALAKKYHQTIRIVTTEGELLNPGGSMSGGAFKNSQNLLSRRRQMQELETESQDLKAQLSSLLEQIGQEAKKKEEIDGQIASNRKVRQELALKQNTAKINYDRACEDLEKNKEGMQRILQEQGQLKEQRDGFETEIEALNEKVRTNDALSKERQKRREEIDWLLGEANRENEENLAKKAELALARSAQEQEIGFIEENKERLAAELAPLEAELEDAVRGRQEADLQAAQKETQLQETKQRLGSMREAIVSLEQEIVAQTEKRDSLNNDSKGFFEKRENLLAQKNALDKECFRLDSQKEKLSEKMDSYTNYMWEEYSLTYHAAKEKRIPVSVPISQLRSDIAKRKGQIKALGDVNVNAVEQYKEVQERYDLLQTQHDDLVEAKKVLENIIEELDVEMRKQFETKFEQIKKKFDMVFKELFGGGRAALELTDEEDILLAGIRIIAQPPGKKLQNMMQLSGGEKALTAIALLFAIQSLKPSPFCLLDEIEAALDDSNVGRFAEYLHKLTKDTQFIVITHRRGTMNAADILYGITMQEKGISTLVSVSLEDAEEMAEQPKKAASE